ncbi:MAG: type II toxin-antitoxin system HicA family toxin [Candidatus Acidiferrales bacterium]
MPRLPRDVSGDQARRAFEQAGWIFDRQVGSHMILQNPERAPVTLSVPRHKTLKPGILRSLIRDAGLSVEEFIELL